MNTGRNEQDQIPVRTFLLDPVHLARIKQRLAAGDPTLAPAYARLRREADTAVDAGPWSVMDKPFLPPSGDKHDYLSVGPYWWPNPHTLNGLPYVRRDGEVNPARAQYDSEPLKALIAAVDTLALASFFSGDERYAKHAAHLLRTWFLDEATRMNPHLEYGQAIPGICEGRGIGIIDTRLLSRTVDAAGLLAGSPHWTATDQTQLLVWFDTYTKWLLESAKGLDEFGEHNNHGTWYDVQTSAYALFTGATAIAEKLLGESARYRVENHVQPDGSQPHELARTRSLSYSTMNLLGLMDLATLAEHVGVDLWRYPSKQGNIRRALDYLIDNAVDRTWPHAQITPFDYAGLFPLLRRAALAYGDERYGKAAERLPAPDLVSHRAHLLYARPAE